MNFYRRDISVFMQNGSGIERGHQGHRMKAASGAGLLILNHFQIT
jgi:hypothetical protein